MVEKRPLGEDTYKLYLQPGGRKASVCENTVASQSTEIFDMRTTHGMTTLVKDHMMRVGAVPDGFRWAHVECG